MNEKTRQKALDTLDGMAEIVRAEMIAHVGYISSAVLKPERAGAICGGRKACAVGSLYLAYGVKPEIDIDEDSIDLPGVEEFERKDFMRNRPGLRVAYDALNASAGRFAKRNDIDLDGSGWGAEIEALFEGYYPGNAWKVSKLDKGDLLRIIASAKRTIRNAE